ncbi:phage tail tip protein, partial [Escherichia coli]
ENEINREMTQLEKDVRQRAERDIAEVTKKITASENSITELVAKKSGEQSLAIAKVDRKVDSVSSEIRQTVTRSTEENSRQIAQVRQYVDDKSAEISTVVAKKSGEQSMAIAEVDRKVDRMGSEIRQTVSRSTEENSRQIAQIRQYVDDKGSQIKQSTDKKLGSWNASIEQIQKVQEDTRRNLNSMWAVKLQQTRDGRLYIAGIGAGIENTSDGIQSQILMQADRIAMINPENGNTTPLFVAQGDQLFMNDVFMKRLFAVSITSSGNPPAFSLTPDGRLTAKNADISGNVNANSGSLNNVTINENCRVLGKLSASQIEGDLVKTVGKAFPRNNSYASGTITVTVYDDQGFDRQIIIPPVLFRGMKHQNFNSKNQQSYWYSTCKLQVLKNGQEIFHEPATDVSRVFSSVIDMPAGYGNVTLTFNVSSYGANNWTPTTSISDLLVVVMKKATAGITIS